jgi:hypothetical protein
VAEGVSLVRILAGPTHRPVGDEIPGKHDQIGVEGVDLIDYMPEKGAFRPFEIVDVRDLNDPHAAEGLWQAGKVDRILFDCQFVTRDFARIERKTPERGCSKREERPAREPARRSRR